MHQLNPKQHRHTGFYWLFALLLILISVKYVFRVNVPGAVFLLLFAAIVLTGDRNEIIALCMCCIPLHESVDFFYSIVICMAGYVIKYHKDIRIRLSFIPVAMLFLWELLHYLAADFSVFQYLTGIIPLIALMIFMSADVSKLDYDFIARMLAIATAANCGMLLGKVLYNANFDIALAFAGLQRLGVDNEEGVKNGAVNPNTLGIICVLASTALMQLRSSGQGKTRDVVLICILLVFGALTSSRTYLVCLVLMVVLLVFGQKGSFSKKIRFLLSVVLVLLLGIAVLNLVFPDLMQYYIGRFRVSDITTGRSDLMVQYHGFILDNPKVMLWGIGLQDFGEKLVNGYRVATHVPHNGMQELVIAWGIPGLIMVGVLLADMVLQAKQYGGRKSLLNYIPLVIILVKSIAGQMITSPYTMLSLSFAYLSLVQDFSSAENSG